MRGLLNICFIYEFLYKIPRIYCLLCARAIQRHVRWHPYINVAGGIDGKSLIGTQESQKTDSGTHQVQRKKCQSGEGWLHAQAVGEGLTQMQGNGVWTRGKNNGGRAKANGEGHPLSLGLSLPAFFSSFH